MEDRGYSTTKLEAWWAYPVRSMEPWKTVWLPDPVHKAEEEKRRGGGASLVHSRVPSGFPTGQTQLIAGWHWRLEPDPAKVSPLTAQSGVRPGKYVRSNKVRSGTRKSYG